jgi:hypothetical protein
MAPQRGYGPIVVTSIYTIWPTPNADWTPPDSMHHRQPQQTSTITATVAATTISVTAVGTPTPPPFFEMGSRTTTATNTPQAFNASSEASEQHGPPKYILTAAGAIVSVIGMLILALLLLFICRRSKRRNRERRDSMGQQMMGTTSSDTVFSTREYRRPEALVIPSLGYASSGSTFTTQSPRSPHHPQLLPSSSHQAPPSPLHPQIPQIPQQAHLTPAPPVLLSTTVNHSYLTGIDTSDDISVHEQPIAITRDDDEPPPPYRPRSLAPVSRQNSVANGMLPNYRPGQVTIPVTEESSSNPFDDPENERNNCGEGGIWGRRRSSECPDFRMSTVYDHDIEDEEPTTTHSTI